MYVLQNGAIVVSAVAALVLFLTGIQEGPQFGLLVRSATLVHILLCRAAYNLLMSGGDDLCAYNLAQTIGCNAHKVQTKCSWVVKHDRPATLSLNLHQCQQI